VLDQLTRRKKPREQQAPADVQRGAIARLPEKNGKSLQDVEAEHIVELLQQHKDNRREVAAALGISERTLYRKLKRYNLN